MPSCGVSLSVCLSRSWIMPKQINISSNFFHHRVAKPFYFFRTRWGRPKTRFWTNIWLRCIQVYSVVNRTSGEVWKIMPRRTAASVEPQYNKGFTVVEHSPRRPLFAQDDDEVFVTGSTLYAGDERRWNSPVGYRRTETDTNPYSWPYPTHEARSCRPQPTHERQQTRGLWPRGVCPGGFGRTPPETIGDSKTEFNRILCTSKYEAAVTSNKKTAL